MLKIFFFCFFSSSLHMLAMLPLNTHGETALLMNAHTGQILFQKNAHHQIYPASTTKLATALFLVQKYRHLLNETVVIHKDALVSISPQIKKQSLYRSPSHWLETDSSLIGVKTKEEVPFIDLLYGMMIASGNDASNSLAHFTAGSIPEFMKDLNIFLYSLGCQQTHFNNPHGLHHPEHVTTAYDLALIAKEALRHPLLRQIFSTTKYKTNCTNLEQERILKQTNKLLQKNSPYYYSKAIGIKTGFTKDAGKNLVAAAEFEDRKLIAVATGYKGNSNQLYEDIIQMFEQAFSEKKLRQYFLPEAANLAIKIPKAKKRLSVLIKEGFFFDFYPSEKIDSLKLCFLWDIPALPIQKGTYVGKALLINAQNTVLKETPLLANTDLEKKYLYKFRDNLQSIFNKNRIFLFCIGGLLLLITKNLCKLLMKPKKSYYR